MNGADVNAPAQKKLFYSCTSSQCSLFSITEPVKEAPGKRKKEMANKSAPEAKKKKTEKTEGGCHGGSIK